MTNSGATVTIDGHRESGGFFVMKKKSFYVIVEVFSEQYTVITLIIAALQ